MATVQSFEELEIWKKAQDFGVIVYELCEANKKLPRIFPLKIK
jgi:hypothetical protein